MQYTVPCLHDQFVDLLLQQKDGYYVDIGSSHSIEYNNTFTCSQLGWHGICIEQKTEFNHSYAHRQNCFLLNMDATQIDFRQLFSQAGAPKVIDYLSLDVDTASTITLSHLPLDEYKFKIITIEHDGYLYGDLYRAEQRRILTEAGYYLLCGNIFVEENGVTKPRSDFEDWWVHPEFFDVRFLEYLKCDSVYSKDVIQRIQQYKPL